MQAGAGITVPVLARFTRRTACGAFAWALLAPSGCSDTVGPVQDGPVRWFHQSEFPASEPFADQELVAYTTMFGDNRLIVLDRLTGAVKWIRTLEDPTGTGMPNGNIAAFEDLLLVPAWHLYAFDRKSGVLRWTFKRDGDFPGARQLTIANGVVFATGRKLYAVDARTGMLRWELNMNEEPFRPAYMDEVVYFTTRGDRGGGALGAGHAVAARAATGEIIWKFPLPDATDASWIGGSIGLAGVTSSLVVVPARNGRVYGLDRQTGALRWERRGRGPYDRGVLLGGVVAVGGDAPYVEAIDLASGRLAWEVPVDGTVLRMGSGPGIALALTSRLFAIGESGKVKWSYGGDFHDEPSFVGHPLYVDGLILVGGRYEGENRRGFFALDVNF